MIALLDRRFARLIKTTLSAAATLALAGCVHLEHFSSKATDFNLQVADSQNKTMLLNIMRAANRFPMHFTELTTLSGTGTATIGGTVTIPVGILNGGMGTGSVAPTGSYSETPTFNVAVLETQEFYKGIMAPVKLDQLADFLGEGMPPPEVFTLLFGRLTFQPKTAAATVAIENNFHLISGRARDYCPTSAEDEHACFRDALEALLQRHLTIENVTDTTDMGTFSDAKLLSHMKGFEVTPFTREDCEKKKDVCPKGLDGLTEDDRNRLKPNVTLYRIEKEEKSYRFCFDVANATDGQLPSAGRTIGEWIRGAEIPDEAICKDRRKDGKAGTPRRFALKNGNSKQEFTLEVEPRSTEGLVYYLGEIARCDAELDGSKCSPVDVTPYDGGCEARLFRVHTASEVDKPKVRCPNGSEKDIPTSADERSRISVAWQGTPYWVYIDPSAVDRSGAVLRMVTQLLALNRSAKDLPAPAVVPILAR